MSSYGVYDEKNRLYYMPDAEVKTLRRGYRYIPTRGSGYTVLVLNAQDQAVGFVPIERLGFESVKAWMAAGRPTPRGLGRLRRTRRRGRR